MAGRSQAPNGTTSDPSRPDVVFVALCAISVLAGLYGRFKGLSAAPVSPDEYYLSRGVDGILKYGLPAFDCGGYYQRGPLLQYLIAGLRLAGATPELAARLLAAVANVLMLPAAFLLARRFVSRNGALCVVSILALSMWEIELARFGRMYAPVQAVFTWYLVYFMRLVVDGDARAWRVMLWLSIAGALTWEGGVFLCLVNFVPMLLIVVEGRRPEKRDWVRAAVAGIIFLGAAWLITADLRYAGGIPPYPSGFSSALTERIPSKLESVGISFAGIPAHVAALVAFAVLLLIHVLALRTLWTLRSRAIAVLGLLLALALALAHHLLFAAAILVGLMLLRLWTPAELLSRPLRWVQAAFVASVLFWCLYVLVGADWAALKAVGSSTPRALVLLMYPLVSFPPIGHNIVQPFVAAAPVLTLLIFGSLGALLLWQAGSTSPLRAPERLAAVLLLLLFLAVGLSHPPRTETRYVAFLYPLMVIVTVFVLTRVAATFSASRTAGMLGGVAAIGLFFIAGDASPRHIATVDQPRTLFRTDMSPAMQAHLEIRDDVREIAQWLEPRVAGGAALVINGVHGFDYYFKDTAWFFVDVHDPNFPDWSCRRGTVERWTNLPLIRSWEELAKTRTDKRLYVVTFTPTPAQIESLASRHARVVMERGLVTVLELESS